MWIMNFTKKNKIIMGVTAGVIAVAVIVTAIILTGGNTNPSVVDNPDASKPSADVVVNLPIDEPTGIESPAPTGKEKDDNLVIDVGGEPQNPTTSSSDSNPVKSPEKPVDTKKPKPPDDNNNGGGIVVGGGDTPVEQYTCGSPNHHCKNAEAHAYIQNLELEGCPFCGSHSCPSFYDVNEWGFTRYNQALCPKYSEKSDPTKYCQDCGRELWSPSNPTGCFRYLQDTDCECGEHVKGNTCHHH